ncbi:hypothetical protein AAVH_34842 [Aphelenchoides avenae]|nr:hypothetical protein AAVH_34842 [Aphelenchus avenae]
MAMMQPGVGGVHPDSDDEFIPEDPIEFEPDEQLKESCKTKDIGVAAAPYERGPLVKLSDMLPLIIQCERKEVPEQLLDPAVRTEVLDWIAERMLYMDWSVQRGTEDGPHLHLFVPNRITMLGANQCLAPSAFREYPSFNAFVSFADVRVPRRMLAHPDWQIFVNDQSAMHPERIIVQLKSSDPVPEKELDAMIPPLRQRLPSSTERRQVIMVLMEQFGWSREELRQNLGNAEHRLAVHHFLQSKQLITGQRNPIPYGYISCLMPSEVACNVSQSLMSVEQWYNSRIGFTGPAVGVWPVLFDVHGYRYPLNRVFVVQN